MRTLWWTIAGLMVASLLGAARAAGQGGSEEQRSQIVTLTPGQGGPKGSPNTQLATLQGIEAVDDHGGIRLKIRISRAVRPTVTTLTDPDRLVFDFAGTNSRMSPQRFAVNRNGLKAVRVGVQPGEPPMTRVVVDLAQQRSYELTLNTNKVIVKLGHAESPSVATKSGGNSPAGARNETATANLAVASQAVASQEELSPPAVNTVSSDAAAPALVVNSVRIQESQLPDPSKQDTKTSGQPKASDSVQTAKLQEPVLAIEGAVQGTDLNRINQAEAGDSTAQYELGLGYLKGIGVPQDEGKAAEWFKTAANQGHIRAQRALSDLYFNGRGVPRDYVRAYTWASIAAGLRGNDNDRLKVIGSRMTAVQLEDAHRRISSWWERQTLRAANSARVSSLASAAAGSTVTSFQNVDGAPPTPVRAEAMESHPTNPAVAASRSSAAATRGQSSEAPASADLVQEPIQSSTLGGGSGSDAPSHAIPTSTTDSPAEPAQEDTKAASSQNDAALPEPAHQAQEQEQQQPIRADQSNQSSTSTANSGRSAVETTQGPAESATHPMVQEPIKPSTLAGGSASQPAGDSGVNSLATEPMVAPPLNAADVTATVDHGKQQLSPDEYIIGEQDQLGIVIWKEPELSSTVVVRPDGKITVPLLNELRVVGLTPIQLQSLLMEKLQPFLNVPQVTVMVRQINSRNVYLIGEVSKEGIFPLTSSTTVLQLIAQAGGLKDFAKHKGIYVLRNQEGKQVRLRFNYDDVIRGKNNQQNIVLQPGDTVVVP